MGSGTAFVELLRRITNHIDRIRGDRAAASSAARRSQNRHPACQRPARAEDGAPSPLAGAFGLSAKNEYSPPGNARTHFQLAQPGFRCAAHRATPGGTTEEVSWACCTVSRIIRLSMLV